MYNPMAIISIAQRLQRELTDLERELAGHKHNKKIDEQLISAITHLDQCILHMKAANIIAASLRITAGNEQGASHGQDISN